MKYIYRERERERYIYRERDNDINKFGKILKVSITCKSLCRTITPDIIQDFTVYNILSHDFPFDWILTELPVKYDETTSAQTMRGCPTLTGLNK